MNPIALAAFAATVLMALIARRPRRELASEAGESPAAPGLKNAMNMGRWVVEHIATSTRWTGGDGSSPEKPLNIAVIGAGPGGLSAGLTAALRGLTVVVFEEEASIAPALDRCVRELDGVEPYECRNVSPLPVLDVPADELVEVWATILGTARLPVRFKTAVARVDGLSECFALETSRGRVYAQRVVLATGAGVVPLAIDEVDEPTLVDPPSFDDVETRQHDRAA